MVKFKIGNIFILKSKRNKGLTLLEVVLVLAIFAVIISVAVSIFISLVENQKRILADQELFNQTSYVLEYMSRRIRLAVKDTDGTCLVGFPESTYMLTNLDSASGYYEGIKFLTEDNVCQEFFFDRTSGIFKEAKNGGAPLNILSSKFTINHVRFVINGSDNQIVSIPPNCLQPKITVVFNIQYQIGSIIQQRIVQTTVSQRNLRIPPPETICPVIG